MSKSILEIKLITDLSKKYIKCFYTEFYEIKHGKKS